MMRSILVNPATKQSDEYVVKLNHEEMRMLNTALDLLIDKTSNAIAIELRAQISEIIT
jgi:hypothetical protein